jgi:hypothetical protein
MRPKPFKQWLDSYRPIWCIAAGEERGLCRVLVGKPEGKRPLGRPGVGGRIILGWIFRKWDVGYGLDWAGSGWGRVANNRERGNEPLGSIKRGEFLD